MEYVELDQRVIDTLKMYQRVVDDLSRGVAHIALQNYEEWNNVGIIGPSLVRELEKV